MPRDVVYWALRCKGVSESLIELVKEMYSGSSTRVNTMYGKTQEFEIGVGLHQGSALSPFLFVVVLDTLTEQIGMQGIWEILYVDDLVIMAKTKEDLQRRIFEWLNSMERGGLKVNVDKTERMVGA